MDETPTGPAEFSHWLVTPRKFGGALPSNCKVHDGQIWQGDQPVTLMEEKDVFEFLGLPYMEPWERKAK